MRIVHVVFEKPLASGSGAQLRNFALDAAFARLAHTTTLVLQDYFTEGKRRPRLHPGKIVAALPEGLRREVVKTVAGCSADLVVLDGVYLAELAGDLTAAGHRVILNVHNVESTLARDIDIARRGFWARLTRHRHWAAAREQEAGLLRSVSGILACAEGDVAALRVLEPGAAPIHVVPNPIPAWCEDLPPVQPPGGATILFVGHLGYRPNIRAAERLATSILPAFRQAMPATRLTVVGRSPSAELVRTLTAAGVALAADPPELLPFYAGASMAMIPLAEGGGTRIKVLEAMSLGLPVVASGKAVEGLGLADGQTYLRAETDAEFVAAGVRLLEDRAFAEGLARLARGWVIERHGREAICRAVATALAPPSGGPAP